MAGDKTAYSSSTKDVSSAWWVSLFMGALQLQGWCQVCTSKQGGLAVGSPWAVVLFPGHCTGAQLSQCQSLRVQPHGEALQDQHRSSCAFIAFLVPRQPV